MGFGLGLGFQGAQAVGGGGELFDFTVYNEAGTSTITEADLTAIRVSINGGSWQSLTAAGLTATQSANGVIQVTGYPGTETTVDYHIGHEWPGETFNEQGTVLGLYARASSGAFPANTSLPGVPVAHTEYASPIEATA